MSAYTLSWLPLMAVLSGAAGWLALRAWRRADHVGVLRWSGWALVPPAMLLTGTVRLVGRVSGAVASWAANLVFNPFTWLGIAVGGTAVVMIAGASAMRRRGPAPVKASGRRSLRRSAPAAGSTGPGRAGGDVGGKVAGDVDSDMAEIEEILRRRGIG